MQIQHADILKGADIYIDGFESFTTREYEIITELLKYGNRVTVTLPMESDLTGSADHELFFNPVGLLYVCEESLTWSLLRLKKIFIWMKLCALKMMI